MSNFIFDFQNDVYVGQITDFTFSIDVDDTNITEHTTLSLIKDERTFTIFFIKKNNSHYISHSYNKDTLNVINHASIILDYVFPKATLYRFKTSHEIVEIYSNVHPHILEVNPNEN